MSWNFLKKWSSLDTRRQPLSGRKKAQATKSRYRLQLEELESRLSPALTITPLTWDSIGLDSNNPANSGPNQFLVGQRVTNTGAAAVTNVTATLNLSPS